MTDSEKLDLVLEKIVVIDEKLEKLDKKVAVIDEKVVYLDKRMETLDKKVAAIDGKVVYLDKRMEALDKKVAAIDEKVVFLDKRVETLEGEVLVLDEKVEMLGKEVAALNEKATRMENDLLEVKLIIENEIRVNIQRVAEGHLDLSRKLNECIRLSSDIKDRHEIYDIYIKMYNSKLRVLEA